MNITLKQLEALVWVADLGSFRKAAERLNTTQPNISARIGSLEGVLGSQLMHRDAGSVRLTGKGQEVLEHARRVLRAAEELVQAAGSATLIDGVLRLGVTEMVVQTWLRGFLRDLKSELPNLSVDLTVDLSVNLEKALFDRSIDLALQYGPFNRPTTGNRDLGVFPMIWVAAPELGLHDLPQIRAADLTRHPVLTHARDTHSYAEITRHFRANEGPRPRFVTSSSLAASHHMALDAMGVAPLPQVMVAADLEAGNLRRIDYDWVPESLRFRARYEAERAPGFVVHAAEVATETAIRYCTDFTRRSANPTTIE